MERDRARVREGRKERVRKNERERERERLREGGRERDSFVNLVNFFPVDCLQYCVQKR
jgi:hypothetical protein